MNDGSDSLMNPALELRPGQLLGTVCATGGIACPLFAAGECAAALATIRADPSAAIRLVSDADRIPHYSVLTPAERERLRQTALDRKRDLDVLQRLGLCIGDTRRVRWLYEVLFERIATPVGICAHDTPGWAGCPHAHAGAYERVREQGWPAMTRLRPQAEKDAARAESAARIATGGQLHVRPHHLMCLSCGYSGGDRGDAIRPEDTLTEIRRRMRDDPDVTVVLVEGPCEACWCCDGFHPETGRCVHSCGLIRDYKKDLDLFCRLGLLPGDEVPARELLARLYATVGSTTEICGYGDGEARSREWTVCSGPGGNPGYLRSRQTGLLGP